MTSSGAGGSGSESVNVSGSAKVLSKDAPGNMSDPGWSRGYVVEGDNRKIRCKYCDKVISGSVYGLKIHLAAIQKDAGGCIQVPENVKKEMFEIVYKMREPLKRKSQRHEESGSNSDDFAKVGEKRKAKQGESSENIFMRKSAQVAFNSIRKKNLNEEACQVIARFFYNNAIPFNVVKSDEFHKMCESIARHGLGFKPPSYHEIRVKYLKQEIAVTKESIGEHRDEWRKTGCTIMIDGWTDRRGKTICNLLVNSRKGTVFLKSIDTSSICKTADRIFKMIDDVIEEVGEDNVVQVVTNNAVNYKVAGEMLMQKRKKLYWTPCAGHCIDLMLEDFEKKIKVHTETIGKGRKMTTFIYSRTSLISMLQGFTKGKDLIRPAVTPFATSYLTLGCLHNNKGALMSMFTSEQWKSSRFARTTDGKYIENVVMDSRFWANIVTCLKAAYPLIKILWLVDSDEKPAMGFIYEEMERAKEKIQNAFKGVKKWYMPIWTIIDEKWDKQFRRPLHAAAYFLNPQFHYSPNFKANVKVKHGLYECLQRMVPNDDISSKMDLQLEDFRHGRNFFGSKLAKNAIKTKHPADWWDSYGFEHPELSKFAIRILSLTCSSSRCNRNWSAFEMVHMKRRNRLKQKTMNDVVFLMSNSKLSKRKRARNAFEYSMDDLSSDDEWIMENNKGFDSDDLELNDPSDDDEEIQVEEQLNFPNDIGDASLDELVIPNDEMDDDALEDDVDGDGEINAMFDDQDLNNLL